MNSYQHPQPHIIWGAHMMDSQTGRTLLSENADQLLSTASVPKLLLLVTAAHLHLTGDLDLHQPVSKTNIPPVGGTGIWQHLQQETLPMHDVLHLIGTASDNIATNVFLDTIPLETVHAVCHDLNIQNIHLYDIIRDNRLPEHPPVISSATAAGLTRLMHRITHDQFQKPGTGELVSGWLEHFLDHSMVASIFQQNPLNPNSDMDDIRGLVKTGTDFLVRAETGWGRSHVRQISYTVIANGHGYNTDTAGSLFASSFNGKLSQFKQELSIHLSNLQAHLDA